MSERVTLDTAEGRLVARKRASSPAERRMLVHEAAVLEAARHPGVVPLVGLDPPQGADADLVTGWIGSHALDRVPCRSAGHVAAVVAALASTVADLHDLGISHGAIEPSHVLLDTDGRPVLCGFSRAATATHRPRGRAGEVAPDESDRFADDVASLGQLLHALLGADADEDPIPDRRLRPLGARRRWPRYQRRALRTLADQALADPPGRRPTARALATAIHEAIPEAMLTRPVDRHEEPEPIDSDQAPTHSRAPGPSEAPEPSAHDDGVPTEPSAPHSGEGHHQDAPDPPTPDDGDVARGGLRELGALDRLRSTSTVAPARRRLPTARTAAALAALGLLAGVTTLALLRSSSDGDAGCPPQPPGTSPAASADIDGDGCPEPIEIDGGVVASGARRWRIGHADDRLVVGDWDCDGSATPALLRPGTGDLFVFDRWARPGEVLEADPIVGVDEAVRLQTNDASAGVCPDLLVETEDGDLVPVPREEIP